MQKKVTAREVKKALELAGVNVEDVFSSGWNDKRKSGRRIKLPYSYTNEVLNINTMDRVADIISLMFPTLTISVKNHKSVHSMYKYTSLTVHVKGTQL